MRIIGGTVRATPALAALFALAAAASPAGEVAVEAQAGCFSMAAADSADALFGSRRGLTFGGAVRYTIWRGAFASLGARTFAKEGERVYVGGPGAPVQKLGFPLSLRLTPIVLQAGYRFRHGCFLVPYAAVGASLTLYREESEVAGEAFEESGTKAGFLGAAGVEVGRGRFRFGAEAGWSTVPGAIGLGGVSKVYGEDDLGGFHALGKVIVAF
jgi:hypothetical protein